jgi:predicted neuraminidase
LLISFYGCTFIHQSNKTVNPILISNFIFTHSSFDSCHASTIVHTKSGLIAAWFAGSKEGASDVKIWSSKYENNAWSIPKIIADGEGLPTWNPVLFKAQIGPLILFYKIGLNPKTWKGMMSTSFDDVLTWSNLVNLPSGIIGPSKNKPIELNDEILLHPSSDERDGWKVHIETSDSAGHNWKRGPSLNSKDIFVIQPTLLKHSENQIQMLMRSSRTNLMMESWSYDKGKTWSPIKPTTLINSNSGFDGLVLTDGRGILVYNDSIKGRESLRLALSDDKGRSWKKVLTLESEEGQEFSYPAVIQTPDGIIHLSYTWKRKKIKHVEIEPGNL